MPVFLCVAVLVFLAGERVFSRVLLAFFRGPLVLRVARGLSGMQKNTLVNRGLQRACPLRGLLVGLLEVLDERGAADGLPEHLIADLSSRRAEYRRCRVGLFGLAPAGELAQAAAEAVAALLARE